MFIMPVHPSDVRWGKYQNFEGPFFRGRIPYVPPKDPDFMDKCLQVLAATEGGRYDAINMYDSCILSVGIIQVCERVFEYSRMLGACTAGLGTMRQAFSQMPIPADFRQNQKGQWRFFFLDGRGEVDSPEKMRIMFLGGSTGLSGIDQKTGKPHWSDDQKTHAKAVAATMASIWEDPVLQDAQREYVKPHLMAYVRPTTKSALFSDPDETGWVGALKAAMISYSANLPAVADKAFMEAVSDPGWVGMKPEEKFRHAMKNVVFGPKIGIWPHRYEAISPVIKKLFGVQPPTLAELRGTPPPPTDEAEESLKTTAGIQRLLIKLGYDLGPAKDDGIYGKKTKAAVLEFQKSHGLRAALKSPGVVDQETKDAMLAIMRGTSS